MKNTCFTCDIKKKSSLKFTHKNIQISLGMHEFSFVRVAYVGVVWSSIFYQVGCMICL